MFIIAWSKIGLTCYEAAMSVQITPYRILQTSICNKKVFIFLLISIANSERKLEIKRPQRLEKLKQLKFKESENKSAIAPLDSFANCYHNQKCDVTSILSFRLNHYGSQQYLLDSAKGNGTPSFLFQLGHDPCLFRWVLQ